MFSSMREFVITITEMQQEWNVEGIYFLGLSIDRYLHFLLCFIPAFIFYNRTDYKWIIRILSFIIILKEFIDLYVIWFFDTVPGFAIHDSAIDLILGFGGLAAGYYARRKFWS